MAILNNVLQKGKSNLYGDKIRYIFSLIFLYFVSHVLILILNIHYIGGPFSTGMSNVRPAGRMRPTKGLNAAREKIFLYVMHVARERI